MAACPHIRVFFFFFCFFVFLSGGASSDPVGYGRSEQLRLFREETDWYNRLILDPFLPNGLRSSLPHLAQTWMRNYLGGIFIYFASGGLWCWYIYVLKLSTFFPHGGVPAKEPVLLQIGVTMKAMPFYVTLPTVSEYMIEQGWTKCYARVSDVGFWQYIVLTAIYTFLVELGIYWMHRGLHDVKPLYKWLHATHHIYNKQNTLSPFAGLAFHPLDGVLQACPHVITLFFLPTHFFTHEVLLFLEGVWTTNIHDCIHGNVWPIMGAGYHTIHHTTYRHNYGHYTILMDWMFGTLYDPLADERIAKMPKST